jgi:hypothetical protein
MGNSNNVESSFKAGASTFTDTFKTGGAFDTLFRVKMIQGIENQINSLLLNPDASIPKDVMKLLNFLKDEVGSAWGESVKLALQSGQDVQKFTKSVSSYLDKVWEKDKWSIIAIFILLNPFAFIGFAMTLLSISITVYFFLMKRLFHPIVSRFFRKFLF